METAPACGNLSSSREESELPWRVVRVWSVLVGGGGVEDVDAVCGGLDCGR